MGELDFDFDTPLCSYMPILIIHTVCRNLELVRGRRPLMHHWNFNFAESVFVLYRFNFFAAQRNSDRPSSDGGGGGRGAPLRVYVRFAQRECCTAKSPGNSECYFRTMFSFLEHWCFPLWPISWPMFLNHILIISHSTLYSERSLLQAPYTKEPYINSVVQSTDPMK